VVRWKVQILLDEDATMKPLSSKRGDMAGTRVMKSLLLIVAIAGLASTTLVMTEFVAVPKPSPAFTWNGSPFRPVGFNYYPCTHPWTGTWDQFNATELARDMVIVKQLGGNCIRTFIQWPLVEPSLGVFNMTIVNSVVQFFRCVATPTWQSCSRSSTSVRLPGPA
jgi:hypothetical protein